MYFSSEFNALERKGIVPANSKILSLNPFVNKQRILRVEDRLINSKLHFTHKHPMLLPNNHTFTRMVIVHEHKKQMHAGVAGTLAAVKTRFWPLNARNTIRKIIFQCMACFRANPKGANYQMGNLPKSRLNADKPFTVVGIDFTGPLLIKDGKLRNRKIIKCYLCVFVCFTTKAVHLEIVGDLISDSFLNALKRFVSRRSLCQHLYSDNITNLLVLIMN